MRGSPLLRALVAFAVILSFGYPLWRLTREGEAKMAPPPAAVETGPKAIGLHLTFTLAPKSLTVRHLEKDVWTETAPALDMQRELRLIYPAEGVDLQFHIEWPDDMPLAALRVKLTDPAGEEHEKSIWGKGVVDAVLTFSVNRTTFTAEPLAAHSLNVSDLTVSYNRIPALHHIAFEVRCGQCVALLGPNGAGKSTLLKALAGLLPRETGSIAFHGHAVRGATQDFAYLPQREAIDWDFPTTVRGLVEMGRYLRLGWWRGYTQQDAQAVDEAIAVMHLQPLETRQISALSGGQQQRAFLARALAQQAHVFLLDEPFTGLDKPTQDNLKGLLRELRDQGKLIIASHHDLSTVPVIFDQTILLNGELIAAGPVGAAFTEANIHKTYHTPAFAGPDRHHHAGDHGHHQH